MIRNLHIRGFKSIFDQGVELGCRGCSGRNLNPQSGLAALRLVELAPDNPAARLMQCLQDYAIYCPNTPTLRGIVPDVQSRRPVGMTGVRRIVLSADLAALHQQYPLSRLWMMGHLGAVPHV